MPVLKYLAQQAGHPSGWFGRWLATPLFNRANAQILRHTIDALAIEPDDDVLDIGFGGGLALELIAGRLETGTVTGIDVSAEMVAGARRRLRPLLRSGRLRLEQADVMALPFPDASFDRACTVNTIYFLDDPVAAFSEVRRVLRSGGRLVIGLRTRSKLEGSPLFKHGFRLYDPPEVVAILEDAGFSEVHVDHRDADRAVDSALIIGEA